MGADFDPAAEAAGVALKMGSAALGAVSFMTDLGEELPLLQPVLKTLTVIREKVEMVKKNQEEFKRLDDRCTYIMACVIVKCRQNPNSEMDIAPLVDCVEAAQDFVQRCSRRGHRSRVFKASSDKDEIAGLNARVDRLRGDLNLGGIAAIHKNTDDMMAMLVSCARCLACPGCAAQTRESL